jgi:hypothetical protein
MSGTSQRRDFAAHDCAALLGESMIPKSGNRFSEKIMLKRKI